MRLFAFLASVLACTGLVSACPADQGFGVGTATGLSDVISNCNTQPLWNSSTNEIKPAVHGLNLVARITSGAPQPYSISFWNSDPNVVITNARNGQSGTLIPNIEQPILIDLPCLKMDGSVAASDVIVYFSFSGSSGNVSFQFHKICELPPLNVGSPGPAGLDADIAVEGVPKSNFNYTSTSDIAADDFYFWIPSDHPFLYWPYFNFSEQPVVRWNNKNLISNVQYSLSSQSILPNTPGNPVTKLTVSYTCNNAVPAGSDIIYVIIDVGFVSKLQFQYIKNCSYGNGIGPATIFNVNLVRTGEYAIKDGLVQGAWSSGIGQSIPQNEHEVDFSVYITAATREGNLILPFTVTTKVTKGNTHMMINDGSTEPKSFSAKMLNSSGVNYTVPMDITCLSSGEATGTVIFDFGQQYDPITIHFQYFCSQPYFNIDFISQDGQSFTPIVIKNIPQTWNYNSASNIAIERFRVTLHPDSIYPVQDVTFDKISYRDHAISPIVLPYNKWMPLSKGDDNAINATVWFNCVDDTTYTSTALTITLDYGWSTSQYISFYKSCGTPPAPASSSSGWSAAGIFFFTIFILTLVGCVSGAGYKYVKEEKRGWEIIPGITYYRSCYENICPAKRYTPQTDYYTDNVPDHGGKSYQTDL